MSSIFYYSLKELRLVLGLSQDLMAGLLQTKRSLLAMAEVGQRAVGAPATLRVNQISQLLSQSPEKESITTASLEPKISDWLERLRVERHGLKKRLEKLKAGSTQTTQLRLLLQNMESLQSPDFNPELDQSWAAMMAASQPDPEETNWETFRLTVELEAVEWKIARLER